MSRFPLVCLALLCVTAGSTAAQSPKALLEAPVWYVDLDIALDATRNDTKAIEGGGTSTATMTMHRTLAGVVKLDLRNPGSVVGMTMKAMKDPASIRPQDVLAQMEHMANWMEGADEVPADGADMQKYLDARALTATLSYDLVEEVKGAYNEMGSMYDRTSHTSVAGTAPISVWQSVKLEMDTSSMTCWIVVPCSFELPTEAVKGTFDSHQQLRSGGPPEIEKKDVTYDNFTRNLTLDTPSGFGDYPVVVGKLPTASATITGEMAFPVHFKERALETAGTLTVRYRLTQQAPAGFARRK